MVTRRMMMTATSNRFAQLALPGCSHLPFSQLALGLSSCLLWLGSHRLSQIEVAPATFAVCCQTQAEICLALCAVLLQLWIRSALSEAKAGIQNFVQSLEARRNSRRIQSCPADLFCNCMMSRASSEAISWRRLLPVSCQIEKTAFERLVGWATHQKHAA